MSETITQLLIMYAIFGMALIEALKDLPWFEKLPQKTVNVILMVVGGALGGVWGVDVLAEFGLDINLIPIADRILNILFVAIYFRVGPKFIHDTLRRVQGEVDDEQFKPQAEFEKDVLTQEVLDDYAKSIS